MYRHQSLQDEINELKILKQANKKIVATPANDRNRRDTIPLKNERPKYHPNPPPQSARIRPPSEKYFNRTPVHVKPDSSSNYNKSTLNSKPVLASIYPISTSNPRIVRPGSSRTNENLNPKSKIHAHIPPLERNPSSHGIRRTNPRFTPTINSARTIENTGSKANITIPPLAPSLAPKNAPKNPNTVSVFTRVHFENHVLTRFKRMNSNKYYKFGIKLLDNSDFEPRAIRYLKIAADQGHLKAINKISQILYDGIKIDHPNFEKKSNNDYQMQYSYKYYGIRQNRAEAAKYFKMAADLGDIYSMRKYRTMLYYGDGIKKDRKTASIYYKIDADNGDVDSITRYATMLYLGDGINQDYKEAYRYFMLAVEKNDTYAMRMIGQMYRTGSGVDYDLQEAIKYYRMATDNGDDEALKDLIKILDAGGKMFMRSKEAMNYYKLAADKGDYEAEKKYKEMMRNRK